MIAHELPDLDAVETPITGPSECCLFMGRSPSPDYS